MRRVALAVALAAVLVLAGCGAGPQPPSTAAQVESDAWTTETPALDRQPATVVRVVDGDTVVVRIDGDRETVRLLGVDTPEVGGSVSPGEFPTVPDTAAGRAHLRTWGERASRFVHDRLANRTVTIATDPRADRRGDYGRLLAYVFVNETPINRVLLDRGYARFYDAPLSRYGAFEQAAERARAERRGLWNYTATATATTGLRVVDINADAPGNDHENRNGEYVVFANGGDRSLALGGWTVSDAAGHTYRVPDGTELAPDERRRLYTGSGTDTGDGLYWDADGAVWNNEGDTILVRNETGAVVLRRTYP
jgi:micrococcal nuclease